MAHIYLSGRFEDGLQLCDMRQRLQSAGHVVTARWLDSAGGPPATSQADGDGAGARLAAIARQDLEDIEAADLVVVFNPAEACAIGRGGRHVETGYALARAKRVIIVGARANVFHWLPQVLVVPDSNALEQLLSQSGTR